jgi:thiamine biosynthesis lipoprotein
VGPLVNLWGFGPAATREQPPSREDITRAKQSTGFAALMLRETPPAVRKYAEGMYVDLSAIAKGYAVDRVSLLLDAHDIGNYLVEVGGELRARGRNARGNKWTVAVESPLANQRSPRRLLYLQDQAVATSGNYRNFFEYAGQRYSHTIDPRTGAPVTHDLASVTVVGQSAMTVDALATGFTVLGPDAGFDLAVQQGVAALFITRTDDGFTERSTPSFSELLAADP